MQLLVVLPALNMQVNDIGKALEWIASQGHDVVCVAARRNPSKSVYRSPHVSLHGDLRIVRPWVSYQFAMDLPEYAALLAARALHNWKFDAILCVQGFNFPMVHFLRKFTQSRAPVAVLFEQAMRAATLDESAIQLRLAQKARRLPSGPGFFRWVAGRSDAIITCDPGDCDHMEELSTWNRRAYYVPWCTDPGIRAGGGAKEEGTGVFAGALAKNKNSEELMAALNAILHETPTRKIHFITSRHSLPTLERWGRAIGPALEVHVDLDLKAAAEVIERAEFGITAASPGGWGFIGNCWAMRTPVILLRPNTFARTPGAAVCSWEYAHPSSAVNALLGDKELRNKTADTGLALFEQNHSGTVVGGRLEDVLKSMQDEAP